MRKGKAAFKVGQICEVVHMIPTADGPVFKGASVGIVEVQYAGEWRYRVDLDGMTFWVSETDLYRPLAPAARLDMGGQPALF